MLARPTMGYRFIHRQAKIAAIRLYERDLLDLEDILDICGFSRSTWFRILKLWNQTGDVVRKPTQRTGQARHLDKEDLDYLLELIHVNPDYFLDEFLSLFSSFPSITLQSIANSHV
jgi:transposase